jgi:hypothetical protein
VVVDRLTKFAHFIPVKHPYTALNISQLFSWQHSQIAWIP